MWSKSGSKEGELVFVAGHPGRTDRLNTLASLEFIRDVEFPARLEYLKRREAFLLDYGSRGSEAFRQSKEDLFSVQNSRKARLGGLNGLLEGEIIRRKATAESQLRSKVEVQAARHADGRAAAWDRIAAAQTIAARIIKPYLYLEKGYAFESRLFDIARYLVRLADEKAKPNSERLDEYRESALQSLELKLFSEAPIYPVYEEAALADSLAFWRKSIPDDPLIDRVLHGRSPDQSAQQFVRGSKLADVSERRRLAEGGKAAIDASDDPMIKLALAVDPAARDVRKIHDDQVEAVERANYALIARALFDEKGDAVYPDATFTLRLAFGVVKGYVVDAHSVPAFTTIEGAFDHAKAHGDKPPYELPPSWLRARVGQAQPVDSAQLRLHRRHHRW